MEKWSGASLQYLKERGERCVLARKLCILCGLNERMFVLQRSRSECGSAGVV